MTTPGLSAENELELSLELADADSTGRLGADIASSLQALSGPVIKAVIYLYGDLGAGKTTLARGLLQALGVTGTIRSPTYTLIEPYEVGNLAILHMDLYRLNDPLELENLGLGDFPPSSTLWLVEWPEHGGTLLPPPDLEVSISISGTGRTACVRARSSFAASVLAQLAAQAGLGLDLT